MIGQSKIQQAIPFVGLPERFDSVDKAFKEEIYCFDIAIIIIGKAESKALNFKFGIKLHVMFKSVFQDIFI